MIVALACTAYASVALSARQRLQVTSPSTVTRGPSSAVLLAERPPPEILTLPAAPLHLRKWNGFLCSNRGGCGGGACGGSGNFSKNVGANNLAACVAFVQSAEGVGCGPWFNYDGGSWCDCVRADHPHDCQFYATVPTSAVFQLDDEPEKWKACFSKDTYYYGQVLSNLSGIDEAAKCQQECQALDGCEFFTWIGSTCMMMSSHDEEIPTPDYKSGPRTCEQPVLCEDSCRSAYETRDWSQRCEWKRCVGCSECDEFQPCDSWCHSDDQAGKPWNLKCTFKKCMGCSECT